MRFLRFVWKLFVMAAVFGVGYIVGREHSFEEEEQWEAENRKNNEKPECSGCTENTCDSCKEGAKPEEEKKAEPVAEKAECAACKDKNCAECKPADGITFVYENEKATKVALVGSFNNWNKDADLMNKVNDNTWKLTKALEPGTYEYQYVVDDTDWVVDSKTETTKNKYEGLNSVIVVK